VRCIDEQGREELRHILRDPNLERKVLVIHMGVNLGESNKEVDRTDDGVFTVICPADLVPKKGHRYFFEACRILAKKGVRFNCLIAGDGPLEGDLIKYAGVLGINSHVEFLGRITHESLFGLYSSRRVDSVVLLSIVADDGQKEGIPVALIEAMSFGIPVISTSTGGIPELIGDGGGIMVREKDPQAIADAIETLINDTTLYKALSGKGKQRVMSEFNVDTVAGDLLKLFSTYTCPVPEDNPLRGITR
jgi:glycosyltransferase involved in cell wall biosynthesis